MIINMTSYKCSKPCLKVSQQYSAQERSLSDFADSNNMSCAGK